MNVLDITADLVDLTSDETRVTTVVRELERVDMTVLPPAPAAPNAKKAKLKATMVKVVKATKSDPDFTCSVCWSRRRYKNRSKIECGHDLCLICEKKMVKKHLHDCPMCRHKDAVFNAFVGLNQN